MARIRASMRIGFKKVMLPFFGETRNPGPLMVHYLKCKNLDMTAQPVSDEG
jgi:hypothetical protein